ncbi:MAG: hypothetical protein ACYC0B_02165 [Gemmatimonadaceae bacterium]
MSKTITLIAGDTAEPIEETLSNAAGPQNLTGATVRAQLRENETGAVIEVDCDVTDAANGVVEIPAAARATWPAGEYLVRWHVTYADTSKDVFPVPSTNTIRIAAAWVAA